MEEQQELKLDFKISAKPAVSVSSVKLPKFFIWKNYGYSNFYDFSVFFIF